jgi:SPP1 gp7 family putative phage head morphogenesis protein
MSNQRRRDPQNSNRLRKRYDKDMTARFKAISRNVTTVVDREDSFGLKPRDTPQRQLAALFTNQRWAGLQDAEKVEAFRAWLQDQMQRGLLQNEAAWQTEYLKSSHTAGLQSTVRVDLAADVLSQASANFAVSQPTASAQLLYTRAFHALEGITQHMDTQLSRILTEGFVKGQSARDVARTMTAEITNITKRRAIVMARTELARVYAEAQLDGFARDGLANVQLFAEWSTAGDDRVCPKCLPMDGRIMTIQEARGLIPFHPLCRCAWIPRPKQTLNKDRTSRMTTVARREAE